CPLAHGRELSRLEMGKAKSGKVTPFLCELPQGVDHANQLIPDQRKPLPHQDQVSVISDITACGTEVDNVRSGRAGIPIGMDVGHDVMAEAALIIGGAFEVDILDMGFEFRDLGWANARG